MVDEPYGYVYINEPEMASSSSSADAEGPLRLYLSLCVYFGVDLGILYSNKEKSIETLTDVLGILIL